MAKTTTNHGVQSMNYHVCGSNSDVESCSREVCLTPGNRHQWSLDQLPFRANTGSDAQPISAVAPLRVAIRGIGNRGADANAGAEEFCFLVGCATNR
jgi:hypothetical protein